MSAHLAPRDVQIPALIPLARGPLAVTLCGTYHPGATGAEPAFTLTQALRPDTGLPYEHKVYPEQIDAAVRSYEQRESYIRAPREDVDRYLARVRQARAGA